MYKYGLRASEVGKLQTRQRVAPAYPDLVGERQRVRRVQPVFRYAPTFESIPERAGECFSFRVVSVKAEESISRRMIDDLFKYYARRARLPPEKRHAHPLRHSIAVHMLDAVKNQLGHKSISSTEVYARISGRKKKQIYNNMERAREIVSAN